MIYEPNIEVCYDVPPFEAVLAAAIPPELLAGLRPLHTEMKDRRDMLGVDFLHEPS